MADKRRLVARCTLQKVAHLLLPLSALLRPGEEIADVEVDRVMVTPPPPVKGKVINCGFVLTRIILRSSAGSTRSVPICVPFDEVVPVPGVKPGDTVVVDESSIQVEGARYCIVCATLPCSVGSVGIAGACDFALVTTDSVDIKVVFRVKESIFGSSGEESSGSSSGEDCSGDQSGSGDSGSDLSCGDSSGDCTGEDDS